MFNTQYSNTHFSRRPGAVVVLWTELAKITTTTTTILQVCEASKRERERESKREHDSRGTAAAAGPAADMKDLEVA